MKPEDEDLTADEDPRASETRVVATAFGDRARVELALKEAQSHLAGMAPSPTTMRLATALEILRRIVDSWSKCAPSQEELRLLREHVAEVRDLVMQDSTPTVRLKQPA
jgi:hypothetical protein